jgi:hypothetical protein
MRKLLPLTAGVLLAVGGLAPAAASASPSATAAPTAAPAPDCGITWGSQPEVVHLQSAAFVHDLRAGRNECYDRLVVDLGPGGTAGYSVRYVPQVVQDPSGVPVPLAGGAFLEVAVFISGHDADYNPTYDPADPRHAVNVSGYSTFRQVAWLGSHHGTSGVAGPGTGSRLVIDVAHQW